MIFNRLQPSTKILGFGFVSAGLILAGCAGTSHSQTEHVIDPTIAMNHELTIFRSPTCGCCHLWAEHMKEAGFQVKDEITEDMQAIKQQYGIPSNLMSCHTTIVDGFVVEGHIPATDVARLLVEQPDISGIAVPGMPIGSPGMESGNYVEPYTVFSFTEDGTLESLAEHS